MMIQCKPYGYSCSPVYVMVDKITDWYYIDYNGRSGTCIRTTDGKEILVSEYPEEVAKKIMKSKQEVNNVQESCSGLR